MDNKSAETYKNEGNTKYLAKEYEEAVSLYTTALELDPKNATYYANRAAAYSAMEKLDKALMDCNKAIELDPNYVKAYFRKAKCLLSMGDLAGAEQFFNQTLSKEPSNNQAKQELATIKNIKKSLERGNELLQKSEWSAAQYEFQSILAQCPEFTTARLNFAECQIGLKRYPEALKVISTVLHNNTQNVQGLYLRALVKYHQGELQPAVSILNTILVDLDPDNKKAFQLLKITKNMSNMKEKGNDFFKEGNMDEAINMYTKALEQDPNLTINHAILYHNLGLCYQRKQEYEKSVETLTKAIEIDENYIKAYTKRAQCYTQLDKHEEAVRDYEMANLKAPSNDIKYLLKEAKKRAKIAARKDYYKIMGVSKTASDNEIRKAYLRLARDKHPDKVSNENREQADKEFKELQEAYGVLSDPDKRAKYDAGHDLQEIENGSADFGGFGGHRGSPFGFGGFGGGFHFDPRDDFY